MKKECLLVRRCWYYGVKECSRKCKKYVKDTGRMKVLKSLRLQTKYALLNMCIKTDAQLRATPYQKLLKITNVGWKSLDEIDKLLGTSKFKEYRSLRRHNRKVRRRKMVKGQIERATGLLVRASKVIDDFRLNNIIRTLEVYEIPKGDK